MQCCSPNSLSYCNHQVKDFFNHDAFLHEVTKYVKNVDIISLHLAGYVTKENLTGIMIKKIVDSLEAVEPIMVKFLKSHKVGLTGSFILQTFLDEDWEGDIDFCCSIELLNVCKSTLKQINNGYVDSHIGANYREMNKALITERKVTAVIEKVVTGFNGIKKIQCIMLSEGSSPQDYINSFDIDVCKNLLMFDKASNKFTLESFVPFEDIYYRIMDINMETNYTATRIFKYTKRGFRMAIDSKGLELLKCVLESENLSLYVSTDKRAKLSESKSRFKYLNLGSAQCTESNCYYNLLFKPHLKKLGSTNDDHDHNHNHIIKVDRLVYLFDDSDESVNMTLRDNKPINEYTDIVVFEEEVFVINRT